MQTALEAVPIFTGLEQRKEPKHLATEVESNRAASEVQAAMVVAKRFPRDQNQSYLRIMESCKRHSLAEVAEYAYPRGKTIVTGASIRLAEVLVQAWGNVECGVVELSRHAGYSEAMAYAWDLETNVRVVDKFTVMHSRKAGGSIQSLTDPRDIQEMIANLGARRKRACILAVIPGDIVEAARRRCDETLKRGGEPLSDRIRKLITAFEPFGVTVQMIEKRLGHKLDATVEAELVGLRKIYQSLKDGMAAREDFFDLVSEAGALPDPVSSMELAKRTRRSKMGEPEAKDTPAENTHECPISGDKVAMTWCSSGECPDMSTCPAMNPEAMEQTQ